MIRESFNANTGIIFDACMLRRELGLDMEEGSRPTRQPPRGYSTFAGSNSKGSFLRKVPDTVVRGLGAPFRRVKKKLRKFYTRDLDEPPITSRFGRTGYPSGVEAEEERMDALSPIFDMIKVQPFWRIFEVSPCKFCLPVQE